MERGGLPIMRPARSPKSSRPTSTTYVEDAPEPSRAGLLRKLHKPTKRRGRRDGKGRKTGDEPTIKPDAHSPAYSDEVIAWVKSRRRRGWTRDQIVASSKQGEDDFPVNESWPDGLSNGMVGTIDAIISHLERFETERVWRRPKRSGGRRREIAAVRKKKPHPRIIDVQYEVSRMTSLLDSIDLEDYGLSESDLETVKYLYDDLLDLQFWMDRSLAQAAARLDDATVLEKIRKLREDTAGRTDAEIETAQSRADILESKFNRALG